MPQPNDTTVAFIGLGVMGYPMAGHLSRAGYPTRVYNRTRARADAWKAEYAGEVCDTPAIAARVRPISCSCASATTTMCAASSTATTVHLAGIRAAPC